MDKRIFMVLLFSFLVCMSVIVLVTCIWKLIKLFAKVKVEQRIEELEALGCKNTSGTPDESKTAVTKNPYLSLSPKEARNLRRLSILAGFDRPRSLRRKSASCSPFRSRSNGALNHEDCEKGLGEDHHSIKTSRTDISSIASSRNEGLGLFANILTCGCCIPIHESLSNLLLRRSSTSETNNFRNSRNGRLSTKRREHFEVESTSLTSQQCRYNQGHVSEEHLELIEKDSKKAVGGGQGKI